MQYRFLPVALTAIICLFFLSVSAQNSSPYWSLAGNSNASASSKLGTTNGVNLRLFTNNAERLTILSSNGYVGIGTTAPTSRFTVNAASSPLRVSINGSTKLFIGTTGGLSVGSGTSAPANGLYVVGNTGIGTATPTQKLHVEGNAAFSGNVGIGTATPACPLDITSSTSASTIRANNTYSGAEDRIAINARSVNAPGWGYGIRAQGGFRGVYGLVQGGSYTGFGYGVYGEATGYAGAGTHYGVYGIGNGGVNAYGVYGIAANGSSFNAAGYFSGNVYANGVLLTSDRKFKQDIQPVAYGLEQVLKLKPSVYSFKMGEYKSMNLPKGKQLGLIADEVKQVFPELVSQAVHPAEYDNNDREKVISPEVKYEAVNYQGLIPVLIASIQELKATNDFQQQQIEKQQQQIGDLTVLVNKLTNGLTPITLSGTGVLEQNTPNPASSTTIIRYRVPEEIISARLTITNAKGQVIKTISLNNRGIGQVSLNTAALAAGTYNYSLFVDGKQADTKRLVIAR
jgi:hypothetical protein